MLSSKGTVSSTIGCGVVVELPVRVSPAKPTEGAAHEQSGHQVVSRVNSPLREQHQDETS